jgi:O-acetyl-ADP-ribose deacetylase (regulator of RNase III)
MITYVKGDATRPRVLRGRRVIVHVCNDKGGWGAGFVLAISKRWEEPERRYRKWASTGHELNAGAFELGNVQWCLVRDDRPESAGDPINVVNMVAQDGYGTPGRIPLRYDALEKCLLKVAAEVKDPGGECSVHLPRIGCGLAGGTWAEVGPIVEKALAGVDVYVYDL